VSGQKQDSSMGDSDTVLGKLFFSSKISALSPGSTYDASIRYGASLFFLHSIPPHSTPLHNNITISPLHSKSSMTSLAQDYFSPFIFQNAV
jgi:hypothetical protein